jgi:parallel beta-helix repeat protein
MKLNILPVIAVLLFSTNFVSGILLPQQIDGCQNITSSGSYYLSTDLVGANITANNLLTTACILISEPGVVIDCAGHTITNNVAGNTTGILTDSRNSTSLTSITIENCAVSNYTWDIYVYNSSDTLVLNNTATLSTEVGFTLHNSSSLDFINNTAYNNPGEGFTSFNSFYNTLDNNTAHNCSNGFVSKDNSAYNTFTNSHAYNVSVGFYAHYSYNNTFTNDTAGNNTWGFLADTGSSYNNFTNCTAYGSYWHGFLAEWLSHDNLFVNDTSYRNSYEGFYMANSTYNTLIGNTAYNNHEDGFLVGNSSSYIVLINNTAYDNRYSGFEIADSNYNNLTGNLYNQSPYHSGLFRYGDGFYLQNATNNEVVNNTAVNSYIAGFYLYNSNSNSFINNTAINNSWEGFILDSSFDNSLTNNLAYANPQFGFEIYLSSGNNLTNNTAQESGNFDLYIDALTWYEFLNFTQSSPTFCNNIIQNLTGSGGRPINYSNTSVNWDGITASEIVLCHADGSNLTNVTIRGSDSIQNNGLLMSSTSNTVVDSSNSSRNLVGFAALLSTNNNFTNNIADENLFVGFADIIGVGNRFANNLESGSIEGGFFVLFSNNSVYLNNTAYANYMAGFAITEGSNNTRLTNNTVHNTSQVGTMVDSSDFTLITGDHYYDNHVDFAVNTSVFLDPLNLSGVIFDNPLGNYEDYTNLSLNDFVEPGEAYSITWSTKPAAGDPFFELSFWGKFINIQASPGATIDSITWHWTDDEAAGIDENTLSVMQYSNSAWMGAPGQSLLEPAQNYISVSNLFSFGIFGMFKQTVPTLPTSGGGGGCSSSLKTSVEATICPDNKVVVLLTDALNKPMGVEQLVTLTGQGQTLVEHTNSSGEVSFTLSHSGSYTIGGVACDKTFNYETCSVGCSSDADCADSQYCTSGECKPVGCPCGQISSHSCHPYACCSDNDCTPSYKCVNNECQAPVIQPECSSDSDCKGYQYCSSGKCLAVQPGSCGYVANHVWRAYECCNNSDCQKGSACVNNNCVAYRIVTDPSGFVGTQHEAWVLPAGVYRLNIMTPKGESKTVDTDATGHATFVLETAGIYSLSLAKEQATVNVSVNAVTEQTATPPTVATSQALPDWCLPAAIIGIILLLAIIYMVYRRR